MNLYEKVKSHCKHTKRRLNQHGQALVLYVIAFPLLFMFVCTGIDIGWYYLNVSRLKNAAEAAAIAGANTLAKYDNTTEDISIENIKKILLVNEYAGETDTTVNLNAANTSAVYYANKNLSDTAESADAADTETPVAIGTITNSWTHSPVTLVMEKDVNDPKKESFTTLFKDTNENIYYYRVTLKEDVAHFMMPG